MPSDKEKVLTLVKLHCLLATARHKLYAQTSQSFPDLRILVGHLDVLDVLTNTIAEKEKEVELRDGSDLMQPVSVPTLIVRTEEIDDVDDSDSDTDIKDSGYEEM